jgi:anti-sigma factor RsiW
MNREPRSLSTGQMLAYVDACLSPADRAALEVRMAKAPEMKRQIDLWLAQNEAIRAAFPAAPTRSGVAAAGRASADAPSARRRPNFRRLDLDRTPLPDAAPVQATKAARETGARLWRACRIFAATLAIWTGAAFLLSDARLSDFVRAATADYRVFADNGTHPVEMASVDLRALNRWFAAQSILAAPLPDLAQAGLSLLGGRIVPGANSPAEFLLYETAQREHIALQIEPLDSAPESAIKTRGFGDVSSASWTQAGRSFVLVGTASGAKLTPLAELIRDGEPRN